MNRWMIFGLAVTLGAVNLVGRNLVANPPVELQPTSPGVVQNGNSNIDGTAIAKVMRAESVFGNSLTATGTASGGDFRSTSTSGRGVFGFASAPTGLTFGGFFQNQSVSGRAVFGLATDTGGTNYGGYFQAAGSGARGVLGSASSTVGTTYGGFFTSSSATGIGVYGVATASSGSGIGVLGQATSPDGYAAYLNGRAQMNGPVGIYAQNTLEFGTGITKEVNAGKIGYQTFTTGLDIVGAGTTGTNRRINFFNEGGGKFAGMIGVRTDPSSSYAIIGSGTFSGVRGFAESNIGVGVSGGLAAGGSGYGMYSNGRMHVSGNLTKSGGAFRIDDPRDPENYYLQHSFVESPDMMNVYNGNVTTDGDGIAWVQLPDYFEMLNRDFRYQLTIVDSSEDSFALAKVYRPVKENRFAIKTNVPHATVSWQVTGIRQDPWAERNRIKVNERKTGLEEGTYQDPSIYGKPETMGLDYKLTHGKTIRPSVAVPASK